MTQLIKQSKFLLLVGSLLLLASCGTFSDLKTDISERVFGREAAEEAEPLAEIKETASVKLLWQAKLGSTGNYDFTPAVEAGYAYVASAEGELSKLDVSNGNQAWHINVGEKLTGGVGVGGAITEETDRNILFAKILRPPGRTTEEAMRHVADVRHAAQDLVGRAPGQCAGPHPLLGVHQRHRQGGGVDRGAEGGDGDPDRVASAPLPLPAGWLHVPLRWPDSPAGGKLPMDSAWRRLIRRAMVWPVPCPSLFPMPASILTKLIT